MARRDERKDKNVKETAFIRSGTGKSRKSSHYILGTKKQKSMEFKFLSWIFSVIISWNKEVTGLPRQSKMDGKY